MANIEEKVNDLKLDFVKFQAEFKSAINLTRYLIAGVGSILFVVFGISYAKLDGIVQNALEDIVMGETFKQATEKAEKAALESVQKSNDALELIKTNLNKINAATENANLEISNSIPKIHQTIQKLSDYENIASQRVGAIESELSSIQKKIPNLSQLSVSGIAKNGEDIAPPWGGIAEWNIIISPRYIGQDENGIGENTILLSADFRADPINNEKWKITAFSRHKFGNTVKIINGEVQWVIFPAGR